MVGRRRQRRQATAMVGRRQRRPLPTPAYSLQRCGPEGRQATAPEGRQAVAQAAAGRQPTSMAVGDGRQTGPIDARLKADVDNRLSSIRHVDEP
jgi:hypothetical protein